MYDIINGVIFFILISIFFFFFFCIFTDIIYTFIYIFQIISHISFIVYIFSLFSNAFESLYLFHPSSTTRSRGGHISPPRPQHNFRPLVSSLVQTVFQIGNTFSLCRMRYAMSIFLSFIRGFHILSFLFLRFSHMYINIFIFICFCIYAFYTFECIFRIQWVYVRMKCTLSIVLNWMWHFFLAVHTWRYSECDSVKKI